MSSIFADFNRSGRCAIYATALMLMLSVAFIRVLLQLHSICRRCMMASTYPRWSQLPDIRRSSRQEKQKRSVVLGLVPVALKSSRTQSTLAWKTGS